RGQQPLPETFARQLLTLGKEETFDRWLEQFPSRGSQVGKAHWLVEELKSIIARPTSRRKSATDEGLTLSSTSRRAFEVDYWESIARLSEGKYLNKNNADCVRDAVTEHALIHHRRDLEALGEYLLGYYKRLIASAGMTGKALAGELPFTWQTDFEF